MFGSVEAGVEMKGRYHRRLIRGSAARAGPGFKAPEFNRKVCGIYFSRFIAGGKVIRAARKIQTAPAIIRAGSGKKNESVGLP